METKPDTKKIIISYINRKKYVFLYSLCCILIIITITFLSNQSLSECIYAITLCIFLGLIFLVKDFLYYYKTLNRLLRLIRSFEGELISFPECSDLLENSYQTLALALQQSRLDAIHNLESERQNMVDYYSLWAHQIKTPIAALNLLLQNGETDISVLNVNELQEQLFRVEQYVDMVLSFLRMESDSTDYMFHKYPLDTIIRGCIHKYAKQFIMSKLTLSYEGTDVQVLTDEKWLSFVIEQILSNAIKYTNSGGVTISVKATAKNVSITISDTGIGIAADDLPRVFENGFTGYNGRTDHKSSGIGLYLCRRVITNLGHSIRLESEAGVGTNAIITIWM